MEITAENWRNFNHIPDEEIREDIADILRENKDYVDENDILNHNPVQNKTRIYMNEGRISANLDQLHKLRDLLAFRHPELVEQSSHK